MLNISGAELRDLFLCMFPFPEPNAIGKAKHKTLWGYSDPVIGSVEVAHGHDLPEMDFADMLRSHLRESVGNPLPPPFPRAASSVTIFFSSGS